MTVVCPRGCSTAAVIPCCALAGVGAVRPLSRAGQTDHAFRAVASVKNRMLRRVHFCLLRDGRIADGITEKIERVFVPGARRWGYLYMDRRRCVDPGANTEVVILLMAA